MVTDGLKEIKTWSRKIKHSNNGITMNIKKDTDSMENVLNANFPGVKTPEIQDYRPVPLAKI